MSPQSGHCQGPQSRKSRNKRKSRKDGKEKEDAASESDGATSKEGKGSKVPKHAESLIINLETDSSRKEKAAWRELNATVPAVPQYLDWSDTPITWDRSDHPDRVLRKSTYALVVSPIVDKYKLTKVLMDGGSNINIL